MRLLIDAGNTRIKWAVASNNVDDILARGVIGGDWSELASFEASVETAWISCVASDAVLEKISLEIKRLFDVEPSIATVSSHAAGMANDYESLDQLGVDRWVAALGARVLVGSGALIVIDVGTAVTIDMVSSDNHFKGGVILPGFTIMHDSLLGRTAGIKSNRSKVTSVIGKNTRDCVNAGVEYGLIGAVDRIISEMCVGVSSPRLLVMGGGAEAIVAGSKFKIELQSDMIFNGLMLLSKR